MSRNEITDDPRLTAYALGELNAADRAAVEQQIGDSIETLLETEAIREVAGKLRAALREETLSVTESLARSGSKGFAATTQPSANKSHSPARRVSLMPTLAAVTSETPPNRRASGKLAVAASCLALVGAVGIVTLAGRHEQPNALDLAKVSDLSDQIAWNDLDRDQVRDLNRLAVISESGAELSEEMELNRRLYRGANSTTQPTPNVAFGFSRHAGVAADQNAPGGLGGYGPPTTGSSLEMRERNMTRFYFGANGVSHEVEGLRDHYSIDALGAGESKPRLQYLGVPFKGRNLPGDSRGNQDATKFSEQLADRQRGEVEERLIELKPSFHRPELLERQSAEAYAAIHDNPFTSPLAEPLSTFSIDVDTAAYSNMRRFLTQGSWPPPDAVRIEELVNYFAYDYAPPNDVGIQKAEGATEEKAFRAPTSDVRTPGNQPFAVHLEVAGCPWNTDHRLVRVGLKGKEIASDKRPVSNIVFLIDVSGSMQDANKLPLVKAGLRRLVEQLNENDRVGIVVYAGASGLVLDSTNATQKDVILSSIDNLQAGGSTNGGEGIQLAYALARKHFIEKGTNRVILCTDGDFNVGITNQDDLTRLIEEESKSGVFLSVLGFGMGNLKDSTLEKLADKGNGNYAYIDTLREANKVFVEQMTGTLITIAKDVKIQIEFNPAQVGAYRLIGYENRLLAAQDFHDDTKDAGEIGAGHTVTALYEIIPPSKLPAQPKEPAAEEKLKYQPNVKSPAGKSDQRSAIGGQPTNFQSQISDSKSESRDLLTIKLRYKKPDADKSQLIEQSLIDEGKSFAQASTDFRFAASVASFGMILRHSPHRGNTTLDAVAEIAQSSLGADKSGYRSEFVGLVRSAKALQK